MTQRSELIQRGVELQMQCYRLLRSLGPDDPWLAVELLDDAAAEGVCSG